MGVDFGGEGGEARERYARRASRLGGRASRRMGEVPFPSRGAGGGTHSGRGSCRGGCRSAKGPRGTACGPPCARRRPGRPGTSGRCYREGSPSRVTPPPCARGTKKKTSQAGAPRASGTPEAEPRADAARVEFGPESVRYARGKRSRASTSAGTGRWRRRACGVPKDVSESRSCPEEEAVVRSRALTSRRTGRHRLNRLKHSVLSLTFCVRRFYIIVFSHE